MKKSIIVFTTGIILSVISNFIESKKISMVLMLIAGFMVLGAASNISKYFNERKK